MPPAAAGGMMWSQEAFFPCGAGQRRDKAQ